MPGRPHLPTLSSIVAGIIMTLGNPAQAQGPGAPLQGLFCNTQEQIDGALRHVDRGLSPRAAVEFLNRQKIVCNYIDLLYFVIKDPVKVGAHRGRLSAVKYEGALTGVLVGDHFRPVTPALRIFFVTPTPLTEITLQERS